MRRTLLVVAMLIAPIVFAVRSAMVDPAAQVLPPGRGAWVLDGLWHVKGVDGPCPPARYRLIVDVVEVPNAAPIELTTPGEIRLAVNGVPRFDSRAMRRPQWRRPIAIDIARWLEPGTNQILLQVHHTAGAPVVRVTGRVAGASITTGVASWMSDVPGRDWRAVAPAGGSRWLDATRRGDETRARAITTRPRGHVLALAIPVGLAVVGLALAHRRVQPVGASGFWRRNGPALAMLVIAIVAHLINASRYPHDRSRLDWGGHLEHVRYNAQTWRPPLATEGWQMYQPPLFYWIAGEMYELFGGHRSRHEGARGIQLMNGLVGSATLALGFVLLVRFGPPSALARALAMLAWGLSPMSLTISAMVTNEPLSGLMSGGALTVAALALVRSRFGVTTAIALGVLCGAALLTKFTGLMATVAIGATLSVRALNRPAERRRTLCALVVLMLIVAATAGPYYARNVHVFGKPFVGNWSPEVRLYEDDPGYRMPGFFLGFGRVLYDDPAQARWSSFWDGLYGSTWGEIHGSFVANSRRVVARTQLILALMTGPTIALLVGLALSVRRSVRRDDTERDSRLVLVLAVVCSVSSVAVFNMIVPFFACLKAFFMLHLIPSAVLFTADGFARIERGLGRARWLLIVPAVSAAILILDLYIWKV